MKNLLKQMQQKNTELEARLSKEQLAQISRLYSEIYSARISEPHMEKIRMELLTAAAAYADRYGNLDDAFFAEQKENAEKRVRAAPGKTVLEIFAEYGTIFFTGIFILFLLEVLTTGTWNRYLQGDFQTKISLNFVVLSLFVMGLCLCVYHLMPVHSIDVWEKKNLPRAVFIGGFILLFALIFILQHALRGIVLFTVNGWMTGIGLAGLGIICYGLEMMQMNRMIQKMH